LTSVETALCRFGRSEHDNVLLTDPLHPNGDFWLQRCLLDHGP
jgi:hypothetical protein